MGISFQREVTYVVAKDQCKEVILFVGLTDNNFDFRRFSSFKLRSRQTKK